ncbi:MAG: DUF481 domain-containing protein [Woeseiaceae bacterium]|nr:DUF481 domain-containing protein [Woeseiaceae bacterium]
MKRFTAALIAVLAALTATYPVPAGAQGTAAPAEEKGPWTGKAALGYLATSGNTESSSLNAAFEVGYAHERWQHLLDASVIAAQENDVSTAEAYKVGWKSEFSFSERDFLFGRLTWRKDLFSGYDQQFSQTVGYGRRLIETETHRLSVEVGAGARQSELRDGTTEDDTILRAGGQYRWQFSETSSFTQDLAIESGEANTYIESVSAVRTRLIENLALVASYTVKNNSDVPVDTEKTDTYTALSIEYAF